MQCVAVGAGGLGHIGIQCLSALTAARWVADPDQPLPLLGGATTSAVDRQHRRVLLFANDWEVQYFEKQNPTFALLAESPVGA